MALSVKKQKKLEIQARRDAVNVRSLNGKGYFMDAHHEVTASKYIETGDTSYLDALPDYRKIRGNR